MSTWVWYIHQHHDNHVTYVNVTGWDNEFGPFPLTAQQMQQTRMLSLQVGDSSGTTENTRTPKDRASWTHGWGLHVERNVRKRGVDLQPAVDTY